MSDTTLYDNVRENLFFVSAFKGCYTIIQRQQESKLSRSKKPRLVIKQVFEEKKKKEELKGGTFSYRDFATELGMSDPAKGRANIMKFWAKDYNPTFEMLEKIAKALDVKIKDLIEE